MAQALPARPNLDWLRKTAKDLLRELRAQDPTRKLADAQFALKAHVDEQHATSQTLADEDVAAFLRHVGAGRIEAIKAAIDKSPGNRQRSRSASVLGRTAAGAACLDRNHAA